MSIITTLPPAQESQEQQEAREGWAHRALVAIDQCFNVIVLRGQPNETVSSHAARACLEGKTWGRVLSAFLNIFQKDHGADAIAGDIQRCKNLLRILEPLR